MEDNTMEEVMVEENQGTTEEDKREEMYALAYRDLEEFLAIWG